MTPAQLEEILRSNEDAPQNSKAAVRLARSLYTPIQRRTEFTEGIDLPSRRIHFEASDAPSAETCGEYSRGLVDLALETQILTDDDKNSIRETISDAQPVLEKEKTIGHFRFFWTEQSSDPDDNVTESDIDATADELNDLFVKFTAEFRQPKAKSVNGSPLIDVNTYSDPGLFGSTSSFRNEIFLNSRHVVRDECRRRTTSAHELFHRVEYAYGYVTGTANQSWWVEALGSWSQNYAYPDQFDYIRRVAAGLDDPRKRLLSRSYDACHFWKLFSEWLAASETSPFQQEFEAVRAFMEEHDNNGKRAKEACETVLQHLNSNRPFDTFYSQFALCNVGKDFVDFPGAYRDNKKSVENCQRNYGPYTSILPSRDETIQDDADSWSSPTLAINQYGSDYYRIRFAPAVTKVSVVFDGNVDGGSLEFDLSLLRVNGDTYVSSDRRFVTSGHIEEIDVASERIDGLIVVVSCVSAASGEFRLGVNGGAFA